MSVSVSDQFEIAATAEQVMRALTAVERTSVPVTMSIDTKIPLPGFMMKQGGDTR